MMMIIIHTPLLDLHVETAHDIDVGTLLLRKVSNEIWSQDECCFGRCITVTL